MRAVSSTPNAITCAACPTRYPPSGPGGSRTAGARPKSRCTESTSASDPVSPTKSRLNWSSQARSAPGVSRAGSVVTKTTARRRWSSGSSSRTAAARPAICTGQTSGQEVYPKKRKVRRPAVASRNRHGRPSVAVRVKSCFGSAAGSSTPPPAGSGSRAHAESAGVRNAAVPRRGTAMGTGI